jgi:2-haloacid dehalogenase
MSGRSVVVFDLGGVLIQWNPRHLYRKLFDDEALMEEFLATVCTSDWNECQDAGRSFAEAEAELIRHHPDKEHLIRAWCARFDEMIPGAIDGVVAILGELKARATPLYALSNWSAETFVAQPKRFPFLSWFKGIVVSGHEGVIKPDPRIFELLLSRYGLKAEETVFIDDNPANAAAASRLGIHGIAYRAPDQLRAELGRLNLL